MSALTLFLTGADHWTTYLCLREPILGWQVIDYLSVRGVLVINVETYRVDEASTIAHELVSPLASSYAEVLVYLRKPGEPLAAARVQWTPRAGFTEIDLSLD